MVEPNKNESISIAKCSEYTIIGNQQAEGEMGQSNLNFDHQRLKLTYLIAWRVAD